MKTVFASVIYPGLDDFLPKFFQSLADQTDQDFDVLIMNDGGQYQNIPGFAEVIDASASGRTPIRKEMLRICRDRGYELVVLGDSDDWIGDSRIEEVKKSATNSDVILNDLLLVNDERQGGVSFLGGYIENGGGFDAADIQDKNLFGFGNTAFRANLINDEDLDMIPDQSIAIDWPFFYRMIHKGARVTYCDSAVSYYRQHGNNIAAPEDISDEAIVRGLEVKLDFYTAVKDLSLDLDKRLVLCKNKLQQVEESPKAATEYFHFVRNRIKNIERIPLWWEGIELV